MISSNARFIHRNKYSHVEPEFRRILEHAQLQEMSSIMLNFQVEIELIKLGLGGKK